MFKKIKESIVIVASVLLFTVPLLATASVSAIACNDPITPNQTGCTGAAPAASGSGADISNSLCGGVELDANTTAANCAKTNSSGITDSNRLIKNVINIFSLVVGIVAVLMVIFGGFKYITSGGNDGNVSGAKNTILYAVIGLVIVALAQIIVRFVLTKATA